MFFRLLKGPVVPVLRMSVRGLRLKTIKLINGLIENLENFSRLSDFKYIFRSSNLTAIFWQLQFLGLAKYLGLMTFLMMLSVVLLYLPMILLCIVCMIRRLIYCINQGWLFNLYLTYKTLYPGPGSDLLIWLLKKLNLFNLTSLIILVLLMWKCMGLLLNKNNLLWCWNSLSLLNLIWALRLSHYKNCFQVNWILNSFYEVLFS